MIILKQISYKIIQEITLFFLQSSSFIKYKFSVHLFKITSNFKLK